jgi:hypothetical protein
MRILICDDEKSFAEAIADRLHRIPEVEEHFEVIPLTSGLEEAVKELENRRFIAREDPADVRFDETFPFDAADIVIVDYDLIRIHSDGFLTGEGIAYLARSFSNAGYIIALNQFDRTASFDLTLRGHPDSFADLNLAAGDLDNPGLWKPTWPDAYRPWYWPVIPEAARNLRKRIESLEGRIDERIAAVLGFPEGLINVMPRDLQAFIAAGKEPLTTTNFRDFVKSSGQGLRGKDQTSEACIARIAAARVALWLESVVLAGQDILVDLPHLVERAPSVLRERSAEGLKLVCRLEVPDSVDVTQIKAARFSPYEWLSRPVWWWTSIERDESLPEVSAPWETKPLTERFAEDISRFVGPGRRQQFVSALASPYARRFVSDPQAEGVIYRPAVRFAMA